MAELILVDRLINPNQVFSPNDPHKQNIKTLYRKDSTNTQYKYNSVMENLINNWQPPWMAELELYGKVVHINKLFLTNNPH